MRKAILLVLIMVCLPAFSQFRVSGHVKTDSGSPISGSTIILANQIFFSNDKGEFQSESIGMGVYPLQIIHPGYIGLDTIINLRSNVYLNYELTQDVVVLDDVVIHASATNSLVHTERMLQEDLTKNYAGSLAKTLERLAGVQSMDIGAGSSKPVIRGLGFNRIAVTENGVKQEGQQWGADHGLEIDALNAESVQVIKGVGTIAYGSDAIGGVIQINNQQIPAQNSFSGSSTIYSKTVNNTYGLSSSIQSRSRDLFYKLKISAQDYGDFRVPTDRIRYLNTEIPVYNNRMKNTAGKEFNVYAQIGIVTEFFTNITSFSNVYSKSGFFPGSHGLPSLEKSLDDGNARNIELPNQSVNHFKVSNSSQWELTDTESLKLVLSYQNNLRKESSLFHSHYSGQKPPEKNPNLELEFDLSTVDGDLKYEYFSESNHKTTLGIQQNYQNNTIGGYGFLLPKFNRLGTGVYGMYEHQFSSKWKGQIGVRFDYAKLDIGAHYDSILYDYLISKGESPSTADNYAQRSTKLTRDFKSYNVMVGTKYHINSAWNLGLTAGTNFRFPTAIELAANGLHHGAFRHEKGDPNLKPERGLSADLDLNFKSEAFNTSLSPYMYYFDNYIYLKPSGVFSILPDGGQIYQYTQSRALITGFEYKIDKTFWESFKVESILEFLYNKQLTGQSKTNYPLPFSPPVNVFTELKYQFGNTNLFTDNSVYFNARWNAKQERIAQNEAITDSYTLFGAGATSTLNISGIQAHMFLSLTNLFDTKAFNHTSYYRPLEVPELGRSIQLLIQIPF